MLDGGGEMALNFSKQNNVQAFFLQIGRFFSEDLYIYESRHKTKLMFIVNDATSQKWDFLEESSLLWNMKVMVEKRYFTPEFQKENKKTL